MYLIGQTDRSGYDKDVITNMKTRTVNKKKVVAPSQGTTRLAENKTFPQLTAVMWMNRLAHAATNALAPHLCGLSLLN